MTPIGEQLVLGIDGGGTKTVAWLARSEPAHQPEIVGRGTAGPANPQAVGFDQALKQLAAAVAAAFEDAHMRRQPVASAVVALAGSDRPLNRQRVRQWANQQGLARRFRVVHDALPVLAAGTPNHWGIALIAGTGSFAFGQNRHGATARAGGWGYLLGDEGSGYAVAVAGLRAAAAAADGRGPPTALLPALLQQFRCRQPLELIPAVYTMDCDRASLAALAAVVTRVAEDDHVARQILDDAAGELSLMVAAVARQLFRPGESFPLALSGGLLLGSQFIQDRLQRKLAELGHCAEHVARVGDPVVGAVRLAAQSSSA